MMIFYTSDSSDVKTPSDFGTSAISETFMTGTNFDPSVKSRQNKATPAAVSAYSTHVG
jgi:hypothetical protein